MKIPLTWVNFNTCRIVVVLYKDSGMVSIQVDCFNSSLGVSQINVSIYPIYCQSSNILFYGADGLLHMHIHTKKLNRRRKINPNLHKLSLLKCIFFLYFHNSFLALSRQPLGGRIRKIQEHMWPFHLSTFFSPSLPLDQISCHTFLL